MWLKRRLLISYSAAEKGLEAIKNYGSSGGPQAGTGPDYTFLYFSVLSLFVYCNN
jgi:hypothetical protein